MLLSNGSFGSHTQYKAVFSDVTGVYEGDDVRIAGVSVGNVKDVEIYQRSKARVTFDVKSDVPLTKNTDVTIKYRNLIGQRYLALTQGSGGAADRLERSEERRVGKEWRTGSGPDATRVSTRNYSAAR